MREAIGTLIKRKFGDGGVYNMETPGAWKDSTKVRSSAKPFADEIKTGVTLQAQSSYDAYGKFLATIPSVFLLTSVTHRSRIL